LDWNNGLVLRILDVKNKKEFFMFGTDPQDTRSWLSSITKATENISKSYPIILTQIGTPKRVDTSDLDVSDWEMLADNFGRGATGLSSMPEASSFEIPSSVPLAAPAPLANARGFRPITTFAQPSAPIQSLVQPDNLNDQTDLELERYHKHPVLKTDTLTGICFKYGVR
jgi:hypothetical protein